jgi:hypothetical protein
MMSNSTLPAENVSMWVLTSEKLPPPRVRVIGLTGSKRVVILEYVLKDRQSEEEGWFEPDAGPYGDFVSPVTHWMPIPVMPK